MLPMAAATVVRGAGRGGRCEYPFVDSGWDVIDIGSPEAGRRRAHLRYIDFPSEKISAQTTVRLAAGLFLSAGSDGTGAHRSWATSFDLLSKMSPQESVPGLHLSADVVVLAYYQSERFYRLMHGKAFLHYLSHF